jgi:drug/metabolite transporter (DMT)-like permease
MVSYVPGMFTLGAGAVRRWSSRSASPRGKASAARVKVMPRVLASGVAIAVISASSYAIAGVLRGAAVRQWNEPVLGATLGGLLGMVLHFVAHGSGMTTWRDLRSSRWSAIAYYGVIGVLTIIAQTCMIASMRFIPVSISNLITMATPIVVTPASFFLLKNQENIRPLTVLGILLVLSGIGLLVFF